MNRKLQFDELERRVFILFNGLLKIASNDYENVRSKVSVHCQACNTSFSKQICKLLNGEGCSKCAKRPRYTTVTWIDEACCRRNNEFDYSKVVYVNAVTPVEITHKICNSTILQQPFSHLRGAGCQFCGKNARRGLKGFLEDSKRVHGENKFDYLKSVYVNNRTHLLLRCLACDLWFKQIPGNHVHKASGCPRCANSGCVSKAESVWLDSLNIPVECRQIRLSNSKWRVDALVDNVVYEFYGSYWHGDPRIHAPDAINKHTETTFGELYRLTLEREVNIRELGYSVVSMWESV